MGFFGSAASKLVKADFKDADLSYQRGFAEAHIKFSDYYPKFKDAQKWLDEQINKDMYPYIPVKTGALRNEVNKANRYMAGTGRIMVYALPYGRRVYNGITSSGNAMHYTNPLSTPHWFVTVKNIYGNSWVEGAKKVVKGK